ncbi:MAG: DNA mismatch repair protein MutS [Oscillospiraceae bacterium]|jgi:DNA mismatch repair ATPase MutS|nr:DNA mismatch repair protein MutS [Oscillospiraceae bacterium]
MKANLMFSDRDFDPTSQLCYASDTLASDLELRHVIEKMSNGDKVIADVSYAALFMPLESISDIKYRQENLRDALRSPAHVRRLYDLLDETAQIQKKSNHFLSSSVSLGDSLNSAVGLLRIFADTLGNLRKFADEGIKAFASAGFKNLFKMLQTELDDAFLNEVKNQLKELKSQDEMLISARLGAGNQSTGYTLRRQQHKTFLSRFKMAATYTVKDDDTRGIADIESRRDRAVNETVSVLTQAVRYLEDFFTMLRHELAFYVGCLNLADFLTTTGAPYSFPELLPPEREHRSWNNLYDLSLVILRGESVTGNELVADNKRLFIVTGANNGGKSTFMRSFGQAVVMAQCGMFVGAEEFTAPVKLGIFTHFKKEEDSTMKSGKLDEEMERMSEITDRLRKYSIVIFNEAFASTNEREGSEIHRQIVKALIENDVEVFSVSHLYTFAHAFSGEPLTQFLRAQRLEDGGRSFKVLPGEPLETAFGEDIYTELFGPQH